MKPEGSLPLSQASVTYPLSWATSVQSTCPPSHVSKTHFNIIPHLRLGLPSCLLLLYSPPKPCMYLFSLPYVLHALPSFDHPNDLVRSRAWSSSFCSLLYSPVTSSLLGSKTLLSTYSANRWEKSRKTSSVWAAEKCWSHFVLLTYPSFYGQPLQACWIPVTFG
jgi:hypothetical protein